MTPFQQAEVLQMTKFLSCFSLTLILIFVAPYLSKGLDTASGAEGEA